MQPDRSLHVVFGATGAIGALTPGSCRAAAIACGAAGRRGQAPEGAQGVAADASEAASPDDNFRDEGATNASQSARSRRVTYRSAHSC